MSFYYGNGKWTDIKTESKRYDIKQDFKNQEVRGSSMLPIQVVRGAEGENGVQATVE